MARGTSSPAPAPLPQAVFTRVPHDPARGKVGVQSRVLHAFGCAPPLGLRGREADGVQMWTGRTGSALSAIFAIEVRPRFVESVNGKRGSSWTFAEPLESKLDGQVEYDMDEQGTSLLFYMVSL
jgi:hypothetical protein